MPLAWPIGSTPNWSWVPRSPIRCSWSDGLPPYKILLANSKSGRHHLKNSIFASKVGNEHASIREKGYQVGRHSRPNRVRQQYLLKRVFMRSGAPAAHDVSSCCQKYHKFATTDA